MYRNVKKELKRKARELTPDVYNGIFNEYSFENPVSDFAPSKAFGGVLRHCAAAALSLILVAATIFGAFRFTALSPEAFDEKPFGISLIVVSAAENDEKRYEVSVSGNVTMELPIRGLLMTYKLKENTDAEISALSNEAHKRMKEYLKMYEEENRTYHVQISPAQNTFVAFGCFNDFLLDGIDIQALSDIRITLEGNGILVIDNVYQSLSEGKFKETMGKEFVISAEEFKTKYSLRSESGKGMRVQWAIGEEFVLNFDKNPNLPLSSVKETVTFTVNYKTGSCESFRVIISFDESGEMRAVYSK